LHPGQGDVLTVSSRGKRGKERRNPERKKKKREGFASNFSSKGCAPKGRRKY